MNLVHLHPMLVHFPIALALAALLFDLTSYRFKQDWLSKAAIALTLLAALGAIAAILSGFCFTKPVAGLAATLKEEHIMYAIASTLALVLSAVVGALLFLKPALQAKLSYLFTALLLLSAACISLTGMKGGSIVYDVWLF